MAPEQESQILPRLLGVSYWRTHTILSDIAIPIVPGGLVGRPRAYQDQFSWVRVSPSQCILARGTFSCIKLVSDRGGKIKSVSLATTLHSMRNDEQRE